MNWTFDHFFEKQKTNFKWIILESIPCTGENQVLWKDSEWICNDDTEHFMADKWSRFKNTIKTSLWNNYLKWSQK